jgi:hypothetical protein
VKRKENTQLRVIQIGKQHAKQRQGIHRLSGNVPTNNMHNGRPTHFWVTAWLCCYRIGLREGEVNRLWPEFSANEIVSWWHTFILTVRFHLQPCRCAESRLRKVAEGIRTVRSTRCYYAFWLKERFIWRASFYTSFTKSLHYSFSRWSLLF